MDLPELALHLGRGLKTTASENDALVGLDGFQPVGPFDPKTAHLIGVLRDQPSRRGR